MIRLVRAQPEHIPPIAARLRPADAAAISLLGDGTPEAALLNVLERSPMAGAGILPDGRPGGIWGAIPNSLVGATGAYAWVLIADMPARPAHYTSRHAKLFLNEAQDLYGVLWTAMAADREASDVRWVEWLGFRAADDAGVMVNGTWLRTYIRR